MGRLEKKNILEQIKSRAGGVSPGVSENLLPSSKNTIRKMLFDPFLTFCPYSHFPAFNLGKID